MKKIVIDLDHTITAANPGEAYENVQCNQEIVEKLREYKGLGFSIAIHTSRNMNTYSNNIGLINANTLPVIIEWLQRNRVPFDEIYVGKPWCGEGGFYVDDKAIRPSEFLTLPKEQIYTLIAMSKRQ